MKHEHQDNAKMPIIRDRLFQLQGEISKVEFAKKLGLSRQTVGFYINGDRIPDAKTLAQICSRCNVSSDWVLGLSDDRELHPSAVDELGLPENVVNFFTELKQSQNPERAELLYQILGSEEFQGILLSEIQTYLAAKKAESIFSEVERKYLLSEEDGHELADFSGKTIEEISLLSMDEKEDLYLSFRDRAKEEILAEIYRIADSGTYNDMVNWALKARCQLYGMYPHPARELNFFLSGSFIGGEKTIVNLCENNVQEGLRNLLEKITLEDKDR